MMRVVVQEFEEGEDPKSPEIRGARVDVDDEVLLWLLLDEEDEEAVEDAVDPEEEFAGLWFPAALLVLTP